MKIFITGASGYIGSSVVKRAIESGHQIISASRNSFETVPHGMYFDLNNCLNLSLPEDVDVVIHLATSATAGENHEEQEVLGARSLIAAAKEVDAKFIFVSSQTAREDAPTSYGRTKWRIEQDVLAANGLVVRLGQVYGGPERGLFGTLVSLVRRFHVLPAFIPSPFVQPIHVDDSAEGVLRLVELKEIRSLVYCLASPEPVTFTEFLRSIAQNRVRSHKFFVPIPIPLFIFFTKTLGGKLSALFDVDRLNSLFELPPMNTASHLDLIGLELRTLYSGMHRSGTGSRRRLIQEGSALLTYLLKEKPNLELVRRYVRMVEKLLAGTPLDIPAWLFQWPASLALLDDCRVINSPPAEEFAWRVNAATVIAEASKQGAVRFLGSSQNTWKLTALLRIAMAVSSELVWRMLRLVFPSSFLYPSKRRDI